MSVRSATGERARLTAAWALERRARRSGAASGAAIVWHAVAERQGDRRFELDPPLAVERLEAIVAHVARRYRLVHASRLAAAVAERRPGEPLPLALTFDDDLPSHVELALPVLARHGAVATAFLCRPRRPFWWQLLQAAVDGASLTRLPHLADRLVLDAVERRPRAIHALAAAIEGLAPAARDDVTAALGRGAAAPRTLDAAGADALHAAGWELGFHTRRHDALPTLDDEGLARALADGRDELPGGPVSALAYPHGKAAAREAAAARAAGYVAAYTGRPEIVTESTDPHLIGRLQPPTASAGRFALALARSLAA